MNSKKKLIALVVSGAVFGPATTQAQMIINDNISVKDTWGVFNPGGAGLYLIDNTTINVEVTGNGSQAHGILVNASPTESTGDTKTIVKNSTITSQGNGAYLVGGYTQFDNSKIISSGNYGIVKKGGIVQLENGSSINTKNNTIGLYLTKGYDGTYADNEVTLNNSSIATENGPAIAVGADATAHIHVYNSKVDSGNDILLTTSDNSVVDMDFNGSVATGNITAAGNTAIDVLLFNKSYIYGSMNNVNSLNIDSSSEWKVFGDSDLNSLINSGVVNLSNASTVGTILTINNNYKGDGGVIIFNSKLSDDSSLTDKLVINGDSEGDTNVIVNNLGGTGSQTLNGIEIITVKGNSNGVFTQYGRIVAGAYDYNLIKNGNDWYLVSTIPPVDPVEPPVDPVDPPVDPVTPPVDPSDETHVNRPEAGSYLANIAAANTLFNTRLHDRLGETQYVDALTGEKKVTSLWLRQVGSHNNWRDGSGQLKTQSNSYVAQLGGDVAQWSTDGLNRGHLGLMAGYGNNHSSTRSSVTGYDSKGSINGYSVGAYGTWFASDADKAGLYVDSWLQYSWFNNQVNGQQLASESYKSKGFTASLETGYTQKLGEFAGSKGTLNEWFIQPQAQATWMGVKADNHREANGTRVSSGGDGNVQTRLGLRTYLKSHHAMDDNKDRTFEPFIEANWLHNTRSYNVNMDNIHISQAGARNIGEVKVGVEGQINPRVNLWGNVGAQMGDKGYSDTNAMVGIKYNF